MADGQPATQPSGSATESLLRRAPFPVAMTSQHFIPQNQDPIKLISSTRHKNQTGRLTSSTLQLKFLCKNCLTSATSRLRNRIPLISSPLLQQLISGVVSGMTSLSINPLCSCWRQLSQCSRLRDAKMPSIPTRCASWCQVQGSGEKGPRKSKIWKEPFSANLDGWLTIN